MQDRDLRRAAARRAALIIGGMVLALAAVYIAIQLYAILGRTYRTETRHRRHHVGQRHGGWRGAV